MTQLVVYDTLASLQPLFLSRAKPNEKLAAALPIITALQKDILAKLTPELPVNEIAMAAHVDAYGALSGYQIWGLFNPTRKIEASAWAFAQLAEHGVLAHAEQYFGQLCGQFAADLRPARLDCLILPGDPANRELMVYCHGMGAVGVPGLILVLLWPSAGNLQRLEATYARAFLQSLRWQQTLAHSAAPSTLADYLAVEGLAAAFVAQNFPTLPTPWLAPFQPAADWPAALTAVAQFYELGHYDELTGNIYGSQISGEAVNSTCYPQAQPLNADEFDYAQEIMLAALAVDDAPTIAAYLYGDEAVSNQGYAAVGLPNFAGFEVAYRRVQQYLSQNHLTVAAALRLPSRLLLAA